VKKENQLLGSIVINSLHKIDANRQLIYDCMTLNHLHSDHFWLAIGLCIKVNLIDTPLWPLITGVFGGNLTLFTHYM